MSSKIVLSLLLGASLSPLSARAHQSSCAPSLTLDEKTLTALEGFQAAAKATRMRFDAGKGRPRFITKFLRRFSALEFTEDQRLKLCEPIVTELETFRVVEIDGPLALKLGRQFCGGNSRAKRRLVAHALDVLAGSGPETTRKFLRQAIRDEVLSGVDWREVLASVDSRLLVPLVETLALDQKGLGNLHFPEGERVELARRLLRLEYPFARVVNWAQLQDPKALALLQSDMSPLQWLDYKRRVKAAGDPGFPGEFENRVLAWASPRVEKAPVDVRQPIVDAIVDVDVPLQALARVVQILKEHWPRWYGEAPLLPTFPTKGQTWDVLRRAEFFYPREVIDAETYRNESRRAINDIAARVPEVLAAPVVSAEAVRRELELPFEALKPHVEDLPDLLQLTKRTLSTAMARVSTAEGWMILAQTKVFEPLDGRMRGFIGNHLPDLIRAGAADLRYLDAPWSRQHWYLNDLHASNPRSVLGQIRALRDSIRDPQGRDDGIYRNDRVLMKAAVDRILDAPRIADELMASNSDEYLISALRDTLSWSRRGEVQYFRHFDLRPAVIVHVQRAMLVYLMGRSKTGQNIYFEDDEADRFEALRRVAEQSGQSLRILHVDSTGRRHVRLTRASRP